MQQIAESGSVTADDGAEIAYTLRGPETPHTLLFCPGLGATQLGYSADADYFAGLGRRTLTFDLRGCGRSPGPRRVTAASFTVARLADDVICLLDALGVQSVDFVGHSLGGVIGLDMISRAPSRVRSLITYGTTYQIDTSWLTYALVALVSKLIGTKRLAALFSRMGTAYDHPRQVIKTMLAESPVDVTNRIRRSIRRYDYRSAAASWPGPILLIRGSQDKEINRWLPATLAALAQKPNFHLAEVAGAGHFTNLDKPQEVREITARFLERLDSGG